jgi:hypothetical protein
MLVVPSRTLDQHPGLNLAGMQRKIHQIVSDRHIINSFRDIQEIFMQDEKVKIRNVMQKDETTEITNI